MARTRNRIAVVGSGIAGLTAAHRLHRHAELTVFEAGDHVGGHTNTVRVQLPGEEHLVDTGFIVFNDRNYPGFMRLLAELGVPSQPSHMGFSVSDGSGSFEYAGTPRGLFAQPSNAARPQFWAMIRDLLRFNRDCAALLELQPGEGPSLREFCARAGYSELFVERLIVPQAAAVWSADPEQLWSFPAGFLARFFANHGMLGFRDRPRWRTVSGGSCRYVEEITRPFADRVHTASPVTRVARRADCVEVTAEGHGTQRFDEVVLAAHADQALAMLAAPTAAEREVLGAFRYQRNEAVLHTDESLLPRRRAAWASWNYHLTPEPQGRARLTYWMNRLQSLEASAQLCVTLNWTERIDPARIIRVIDYSHPVFTPESVAAQGRHADISGVDRIHYCGAHWGWGFHEDGVASALRALELRSARRPAPGLPAAA